MPRWDSIFDELRLDAGRSLAIKIAVQGTESAVLEGNKRARSNARALSIELCPIPTYQGETYYLDILNDLYREGFRAAFYSCDQPQRLGSDVPTRCAPVAGHGQSSRAALGSSSASPPSHAWRSSPEQFSPPALRRRRSRAQTASDGDVNRRRAISASWRPNSALRQCAIRRRRVAHPRSARALLALRRLQLSRDPSGNSCLPRSSPTSPMIRACFPTPTTPSR